MPGDPLIASIIVPAYYSQATIGQSLAALFAQSRHDFEVVVVDSSPDSRTGDIVRASFPQVRYVHESTRLLPHQARNRGAQFAASRVLVFTDPDCVAAPDWLERLLEHHANGRPVVGGSLRSLPGVWNEAVHLTKYPWWDPMSRGGRRPEIPTGNFSIDRDLFDAVHGFRGQYFAGDSEICWRILDAGHQIWFEPRAIVTHLQHAGLAPFALERFQRGRDFGRTRVDNQRWSRRRCLAYLLASPALPLVMTARSAKYARRGGYLLRWLLTAPIQLLGNCLWCGGEAAAHWKALWRKASSADN